MKKRIGCYVPVKSFRPQGNQAPKGVLPAAAVEEMLQRLQGNPLIECDILGDISAAVIRNGKVYAEGRCLSDLDMFFWFCQLPEDRDAPVFTVLRTLQMTTLVLPKPAGVERAMDKFTSHSLLRAAGAPTADFCQFSSDQLHSMAGLLDEWGCLLLKPSLGSFGHGIVKVDSMRQFVDTVEYAASFAHKPLSVFCERFERNDISKWISTTIMDGELVYGYRKRPEKFADGWKVYDAECIGGGVDYVDPEPVRDMVMCAYQALGADIAGFDCIFSERLGQYLIVDENSCPGMYPDCFTKAGKGSCGALLANMILRHALQEPGQYATGRGATDSFFVAGGAIQ